MECPDDVFEDEVGMGYGTLPKVVSSVGQGAEIEAIDPTLAGGTEEIVARVHLHESIESCGWSIEPYVGIVEIVEHGFEIECQ